MPLPFGHDNYKNGVSEQEAGMRLAGKVAFITGGARGMGAAEAKLFAREGAKVVVADVLVDEGEKTVEEIIELGGDAFFITLDVTNESDWETSIGVTVEKYGKLDILVNNAGIVIPGGVEETSVEDWDFTMDVNAKGVFLGTKAVIPEMRKSGGGSIVNISSTAGIAGMVDRAAYTSSKGAVRIFTKSTALECANDGIRANSVHPGLIRTPLTEGRFNDPDFLGPRMDNLPLGRPAEPEEVAYGVLYLASDESSYVTGSELVIDGGFTAV